MTNHATAFLYGEKVISTDERYEECKKISKDMQCKRCLSICRIHNMQVWPNHDSSFCLDRHNSDCQ